MKVIRLQLQWMASIGILVGGLALGPALAGNIDFTNKFAYGENVGWINLAPDDGPGVTVTATMLSGFAWAENIGWINFSSTLGGVVNDGAGHLSGFAWGENTGWINFAPTGGGVFINACGEFNGTAWGENIGWLSFRSGGPAPFKVTTSWVSPVDTVPPTTGAMVTPGGVWSKTAVSVTLSATDCGSGVTAIHSVLDGNPEVVVPGSSAVISVTTEGTHSISYFSVDNAGNSEPVNRLTFGIDQTPPVLTVSSPADGATYFVNQNVVAGAAAEDALSGIGSLTGTVPSGTAIDTSTAGTHSFTVTATDQAGNTTSVTRTYTVIFPGNIDPANNHSQFAYGENVGWINFQPSYGPGVTVTDSAVTGLALGENIGWINLSPTAGGGIRNDGTGHLSGFAWGENIGWINFAATGAGVTIDPATGKFSGKAWGENIGWISFNSTGPIEFGVTTSWRAMNTPVGTNVVVRPVDTSTGATPATLTFAAVSQAGTTNLTSSPVGPPSPSGFQAGSPAMYFELTTTAMFSGSTTVCINYGGITFSTVSSLRLLHFEGGAWVDRTSSLDTINRIICATVSSLSPFAVLQTSDLTPPTTTAGPAPGPNANGWNNTNVTVNLSASDNPGGTGVKEIVYSATGGQPLVSTTIPGASTSVTFTAEGVTTLTYFARDIAGNQEVSRTLTIRIDKTPPTISVVQTPPANSAGWNNTDVTKTYTCADALSGMASCPPAQSFTTEGHHPVIVTAMDFAGNTATHTQTINIDKTPPEAYNQFDPLTKDVLVFGRDPLSGVPPGPVPPLPYVQGIWDPTEDDDDDEDRERGKKKAGLRTYNVTDLAGNSLNLVEKVKNEEREIKARILSLQYNNGPVLTPPKNQKRFEWKLNKDRTLKELEQKMRVGKGNEKETVRAEFDAKKNRTAIKVEHPGPDTKLVKPGLVLLRLATDKGDLDIEF